MRLCNFGLNLVVGLAIAFSATTAQAISLIYEYVSTVDASPIGLGTSQPISVLYGFDSATPDIYSGTNLGGYELQSLNISLGGYTTTLTNPGYPSGVILVGDNNSLDSYGVVFVNGGPIFSGLINGWQLQSGDFSISSGNTTAWSNDSLILSTSLLNSLPYSSLSLTFVGAPDTVRHPGQFGGQFTTTPFSITVVPEPSTFVLLGAGTLSLFAYVWRRRNLAA